MTINDSNWKFLHDATGLSLTYNDMYFRYLRSQGYTGTLQDMIGKSERGLNPSGLKNPSVGTAPAWAVGSDLYRDFMTNTGNLPNPTDTHAQSIYAPNAAGVYTPFAANELVRTDLGLQTVPTRTNLALQSGSIGTSPWSVNGSPGAVGGRSDPFGGSAATRITRAGSDTGWFQLITTTAAVHSFSMLFKMATGATNLRIGTDTAGNNYSSINTSTLSIANTGSSVGSVATVGNGWYLFTATSTLTAASTAFLCYATGADGAVDVISGQLEAGPFATPPILTTGAAVTVNGNQQVIGGLGTQLAQGVAGFVQFDAKAINYSSPSGVRILEFNAGSFSNAMSLRYNISTQSYVIERYVAGVLYHQSVQNPAVGLLKSRTFHSCH